MNIKLKRKIYHELYFFNKHLCLPFIGILFTISTLELFLISTPIPIDNSKRIFIFTIISVPLIVIFSIFALYKINKLKNHK